MAILELYGYGCFDGRKRRVRLEIEILLIEGSKYSWLEGNSPREKMPVLINTMKK